MPNGARMATDRTTLKPNKGDVVYYQGARYVVLEVGLRFLKIRPKNDESAFSRLVKVSEVSKVYD